MFIPIGTHYRDWWRTWFQHCHMVFHVMIFVNLISYWKPQCSELLHHDLFCVSVLLLFHACIAVLECLIPHHGLFLIEDIMTIIASLSTKRSTSPSIEAAPSYLLRSAVVAVSGNNWNFCSFFLLKTRIFQSYFKLLGFIVDHLELFVK